MKVLFWVATLMCISLLFGGCAKDYKSVNEETIQQYIEDNNLTAIALEDGLYYTIDKEGTGSSPSYSSVITLNYRGYYTDGTQFDATTTAPATFPLRNLIKGWQYALPYYKEGGKGKLLIPSHLGYGATPPAGIRANAVLIFDIELLQVQ